MAVSSLNSQSSIYSIVSGLMSLERQPVLKLQVRKGEMQTLDAIYTDLKGTLTALRTATTGLTDVVDKPMDARVATSSNNAILTATSNSSSALGAHSIAVSQLARNHSMVSNQVSQSATTLRTALGVGDQSFSITVKGQTVGVTVSIDEDDTDADVIAATSAAINVAMEDAEDPVRASALNDTSTTSKLVIRSEDTGSAFKMTLADTSGGLLAALGIDNEAVAATATTGGYIHADDELDALLTIDGVSVTRGTNTISDILPGLTLMLHGHQEAGADAVDLNVESDSATVRTTVDDFITKFNSAVSQLKSKTSVDRTTGARQPLAGQSLYRTLLSDLRTTVAEAVNTGVSTISTLSDIGIEQDSDGNLSVSDSEKLTAALESNSKAVTALFTAAGGIATKLDTALDPFVKAGGYLDNDSDTLDSRITAMDEAIKRQNERLVIREQRLIAQYSQLMDVVAKVNAQQASFAQIMGAAGY